MKAEGWNYSLKIENGLLPQTSRGNLLELFALPTLNKSFFHTLTRPVRYKNSHL